LTRFEALFPCAIISSQPRRLPFDSGQSNYLHKVPANDDDHNNNNNKRIAGRHSTLVGGKVVHHSFPLLPKKVNDHSSIKAPYKNVVMGRKMPMPCHMMM